MCPITSLLRMTSPLDNFPILGEDVSLQAHPTILLAMPRHAVIPVVEKLQKHFAIYEPVWGLF